MVSMDVALDHQSPVPLYHQLAETLRYRIATGDIAAGTVLPALRLGAKRWGVNLHTVRQAYAELARDGVVVTQTPGGTRVLPVATTPPRRDRPAAARQFARSVALEARLRHGLGVAELIALLGEAEAAVLPAVAVVECSATQAQDLARQLEERWQVRAVPWLLGAGPPPPDHLVVATYFHYNDLRREWPDRLRSVRFVPIAPEAELAESLARGRVVLCERDESMARNIAADLVRILPAPTFRVALKVVARARDALRGSGAAVPVLFSPRMWGELSEEDRRDPRAHQVRYVLDSDAIAKLAVEEGWSRT